MSLSNLSGLLAIVSTVQGLWIGYLLVRLRKARQEQGKATISRRLDP